MRVRVTKRFMDYRNDNVIREAGDEYTCSRSRFEEVNAKLPGRLVEVKRGKREKE